MREPDVTHRIMSSIHSRDTKPEMALRKALWHEKLRYRINVKNLPGKPDIVFTKARVAIFCDGDFWHGHNWAIRGMKSLEEELDGYNDFWREKIIRNVERDKLVTEKLIYAGWVVLRFWESDIKKDLDGCVRKVKAIVCER